MYYSNRTSNDRIPTDWVDLSADAKKLKKVATITLSVLSILATVGLIVGCYYLATTTRTELSLTGQLYQDSNAVLMIIPLMLGSPLIIAGFIGAVVAHRWGKWNDDPNKYTYFALLKEFQQADTINAAFITFYNRNTLRPAVLAAVLSPKQADMARTLLERYASIAQEKIDYDNRWTTGPTTERGKILLKTYNELNGKWSTLQQQILNSHIQTRVV